MPRKETIQVALAAPNREQTRNVPERIKLKRTPAFTGR